ncbi:hypothetical protein CC80DRAFT_116759 [Byssothecium circinans]|uniref:Uncharacterized protein n=1 Tax=Byssothecium circinans TaxID=147558 RepID=A0A6A5TVU6_9PLEO|nr:hypothetical protein CC80DRAFT_116759 [Byssothecium circinans]
MYLTLQRCWLALPLPWREKAGEPLTVKLTRRLPALPGKHLKDTPTSRSQPEHSPIRIEDTLRHLLSQSIMADSAGVATPASTDDWDST